MQSNKWPALNGVDGMSLTIQRDAHLSQFLSELSSLLYLDEPTNSLMLGLCENMLQSVGTSDQAPILLRVLRNGKTSTGSIQTPGMPFILCTAQNDELSVLAKYLYEKQILVPGVVGPQKETEEFARLWTKLSNQPSVLGMGQKIYKIEKVRLPSSEGHLRVAQSDELDLITQWLVEFGEESLPPPERKTFAERLPYAKKAIEKQFAHVWVVDGKPVSMAHIGRPTKNGISVSAVYTPVALRKNGYASALVAHLSHKMLDAGKKFCVLYTDLANPTSNKIYQNIGYQEVSASVHFLFDDRKA